VALSRFVSLPLMENLSWVRVASSQRQPGHPLLVPRTGE
jgi:hypothetical protein